MDRKQSWHVIYCKPRKERQVYAQLCEQTIEAFYPTIRVKPVNPRSAKIRPYFPRYLFVRADLNEIGIGALQWIPGVQWLVQFGGEPAIVPDEVIAALKQRLIELNKNGPRRLNSLQPGTPVQITSGALTGYRAIFDKHLSGDDRARVLLDILGRSVNVEINTLRQLRS
jgi:transcriptional antiterminator RfaH